MQKRSEPKSFWSTLPGLLTALGGLIAGVAALLTALSSVGVLGQARPTPTPVPTPTAVPAPTMTAASTPTATAFVLRPSPTAAPIRTASAATRAVTPPGAVLLEDDFSSAYNNWLSRITVEVEKGYQDSEFRFAVYATDHASWSYPDPPREFTDFALEVDARRVAGPLDNEYGVLIRYQSDSDEFYLFAVSSDGFYSVQKYQNDEWTMLVKWLASSAIRQGDAVNRLRVTAQGPEMRYYVNGEFLTQVRDASFRSGNVGLLVSTGDQAGVVIAFDNLRVRPLAAP